MSKYNKNHSKIQNILAELKLDVIIITDRYNMNYLSGYMGDTGCLLYMKNVEKVYALTDSRYTEQLAIEGKAVDVVDISVDGYAATICNLIKKHEKELFLSNNKDKNSVLRIGFEDEDISYKQYKAFEEKISKLNLFSKVEFVELGSSVSVLRSIKTKEEIEKMAMAESIGDKAFEDIIGYIKPQMTEREVALRLEITMKKLGASGLSFDTIVASGPNSSLPHAMPSDKRILPGDFVTMDFGCIYEGYCSDMTRTVFVGSRADIGITDGFGHTCIEVSEKQKLVYDTVLKAQLEALAMIKPGVVCSEVDACARKIISDAGFGEYFGHGLGHSVGLFIHEEPRFSKKCDDVLQPGVVITVEPGIYIPGEFGVRIEDMVVVTEDGYRNLASSPKELLYIA